MAKRILFIGIIYSLFFTCGWSQVFKNEQPIPFDSTIRKGTLSNGLVYLIKYNKQPEKRAELRLVVNAGSILEDTDQIGLAHFTEHMLFNGTRRFPKNQLVSYLQSMGIRFGPEINAYTSFDETVYMLQVPTDNSDLFDKSFQILEDWAHQATFDSIEIDKERGVIFEEWRLGRGADQRLEDKYLPLIFHNSRYAIRLPIGTKENLESFHHSSLKRFYADWYRPDLIGVVAVGDFDVNLVEQKIKEYFSNIPQRKIERERIIYDVPSHPNTLYGVFSDKEASSTNVAIFYKQPFIQETTIGDYRNSVLRLIYFQMVNDRMAEILKKPNSPFIQAYSYYGNIGARKINAYVSIALAKDGEIENTLNSLLLENARIKKFGFTTSELERAKLNVYKLYEKYYNERENTESDNFADELIRHFLLNEPVPGIKNEFEIIKQSLPTISLDEINQLPEKWLIDSNRVVIVTAPEKDDIHLPDSIALRRMVENLRTDTIVPYNEGQVASSLIDQLPPKGRITGSRDYKKLNTTEIVLSNGAKVLLKPTHYKKDEILLTAISKGGYYLYPIEDNYSAKYCANVIQESGVGNFSALEIQKYLAGKNVRVAPFVSEYTEGISASASIKDIQDMFQLVYLYFTQPRLDTSAVASWILRTRAYYANILADPVNYYYDQVLKTITQNHPRANRIPTPEMIDRIVPSKSFEIYKQRFANAADFSFILVGNFSIDTIKPFLEQYIASLPSNKQKESWKDPGIRYPQEARQDVFKGTDPKSMVSLIFSGIMKYNIKNAYYLQALEDYFDIRLIEVLREEKSGVYGVNANGSLERIPYSHYVFSFTIPCAPTNVDSMVASTFSIIKDVKAKGISDEYLKKIKETQMRELEVNTEKNSYWLGYLQNTVLYNDDINRLDKRKELMQKLSSTELQQMARKIFQDKYIIVTLYPEK
jgi:zinc protease